MQAVNNRMFLRLDSLPDIKLEDENCKNEEEKQGKQETDKATTIKVVKTPRKAKKRHINRSCSVKIPRPKHLVTVHNF